MDKIKYKYYLTYQSLYTLVENFYKISLLYAEDESIESRQYWSGAVDAYAILLKHLNYLKEYIKTDSPTHSDLEKKQEDSGHLNGFRCTNDLYPEQ